MTVTTFLPLAGVYRTVDEAAQDMYHRGQQESADKGRDVPGIGDEALLESNAGSAVLKLRIRAANAVVSVWLALPGDLTARTKEQRQKRVDEAEPLIRDLAADVLSDLR